MYITDLWIFLYFIFSPKVRTCLKSTYVLSIAPDVIEPCSLKKKKKKKRKKKGWRVVMLGVGVGVGVGWW